MDFTLQQKCYPMINWIFEQSSVLQFIVKNDPEISIYGGFLRHVIEYCDLPINEQIQKLKLYFESDGDVDIKLSKPFPKNKTIRKICVDYWSYPELEIKDVIFYDNTKDYNSNSSAVHYKIMTNVFNIDVIDDISNNMPLDFDVNSLLYEVTPKIIRIRKMPLNISIDTIINNIKLHKFSVIEYSSKLNYRIHKMYKRGYKFHDSELIKCLSFIYSENEETDNLIIQHILSLKIEIPVKSVLLHMLIENCPFDKVKHLLSEYCVLQYYNPLSCFIYKNMFEEYKKYNDLIKFQMCESHLLSFGKVMTVELFKYISNHLSSKKFYQNNITEFLRDCTNDAIINLFIEYMGPAHDWTNHQFYSWSLIERVFNNTMMIKQECIGLASDFAYGFIENIFKNINRIATKELFLYKLVNRYLFNVDLLILLVQYKFINPIFLDWFLRIHFKSINDYHTSNKIEILYKYIDILMVETLDISLEELLHGEHQFINYLERPHEIRM